MVSEKTKFRLHTASGCLFYPTIVYVMAMVLIKAFDSGVIGVRTSECSLKAEPFCFISQAGLFALFALFCSWGTAVAWHDLLTRRASEGSSANGLSSFFRSAVLVRKGWFALPLLAIILSMVAIKELFL
jgi:hypothetical protein